MSEDNGHQDVGELKRQLEIARQSQAGETRRVGELTAQLAEQEATLNKTWQSRFDQIRNEKMELSEQLEKVQGADAKAEKDFKRKMEVHDYAVKRGVDPRLTMEIVGVSEGLDDFERIDKFADLLEDTQMNANAYFAKQHAGSGPRDGAPKFKTINDYSDREIKDMPESMFVKLTKEAGMRPQTKREKWGRK